MKKIEEIMKKIKSKEIKMKYIAKLHWNVTSLLSYWGKSAPDVKVLKELKAVALRNVSAFRRIEVVERRY